MRTVIAATQTGEDRSCMNIPRSVKIAPRVMWLTAVTILNFYAYVLHGFASNATTKPDIPGPHSDYRTDWPVGECLDAHVRPVMSISMAPTIHRGLPSPANGYAENRT